MTNRLPFQNEIHSSIPLTVDEVITFLRMRWGVTYELQLLVRGKNLYLQVMWRYLEQQSFPKTEVCYRSDLSEILEIVNEIGQAELVREWLETLTSRPRIGRALTLQMKEVERLKEFLL